jgi:xanthine dehydrogenase accessory factor
MRRELLDRLVRARAGRAPAALVTRLGDGAQALFADAHWDGDLAPPDAALLAELEARLHTARSGPLRDDLFVCIYAPPPRLVLVGAVHIAQALAPMAQATGFDVVVVDPRTRFASAARFPGTTLNTDWPDIALRAIAPDARTAIVTLTHDPKLDDPALLAALASEAFFIGALGSRKTHDARLRRLRGAGAADAMLARIHAPVGLPLGGRAPAELALSVLAQVVQARYRVH